MHAAERCTLGICLNCLLIKIEGIEKDLVRTGKGSWINEGCAMPCRHLRRCQICFKSTVHIVSTTCTMCMYINESWRHITSLCINSLVCCDIALACADFQYLSVFVKKPAVNCTAWSDYTAISYNCFHNYFLVQCSTLYPQSA